MFCNSAVVSLSTSKSCSNECICQVFIQVLSQTCAVGSVFHTGGAQAVYWCCRRHSTAVAWP